MNFGGPIDLTPFGALLTGIGWLYWLVALVAAGFALWLPKRWIVKLPLAVLVLAVFIVPITVHVDQKKQVLEARRSKLDEAMALFAERCKTAGEKINRTVENVEGVVWMKWRGSELNLDDQFATNDPYGHDCSAEDCIVKLLRASKGMENDPNAKRPNHIGYRYVESIDPNDGQRYRYVMRLVEQDPRLKSFPRPQIEREAIAQFTARYGITWDDISTHEDREHWIAGGSLKVIDLQTNDVIAERIGYMVDRGLGSKAGFAAPWAFALRDACPSFSVYPDGSQVTRSYPLTETLTFVIKVLRPSKGE